MVQLTITLDEATGNIQVNGPIDQTILAYGLLEAAKQAIIDHSKQPKSLIQPVSMTPPLNLLPR